jgi:hypothetical protein
MVPNAQNHAVRFLGIIRDVTDFSLSRVHFSWDETTS